VSGSDCLSCRCDANLHGLLQAQMTPLLIGTLLWCITANCKKLLHVSGTCQLTRLLHRIQTRTVASRTQQV